MSDNDDEDSMLIAANLTKATKAKKPAKGLTSFCLSLLHYLIFAFLLLPIAKRQRWFYEPVVDDKSPYWDGPVAHAAVDVPVDGGNSQGVEEIKTADNEDDNTPIAASLLNTGLPSYCLSSLYSIICLVCTFRFMQTTLRANQTQMRQRVTTTRRTTRPSLRLY